MPALSFEGTPVDIIRRIVSAYVGWASEHPSLHEFAQQDPPGPGAGQMERAIQQIAGQIEDLINVGVEVLHVRLDEDEVAALDPLVFGLVGGVFTLDPALAVAARAAAGPGAVRRAGDRGGLAADRRHGRRPAASSSTPTYRSRRCWRPALDGAAG